MIRKIKNWIHSKLFILPDESSVIVRAPTQQCDIRDSQARKRVKAAFEAQALEMNARAMVPHDISCKDPVSCKKKRCFKWEPDVIVSDPVIIQPREIKKN